MLITYCDINKNILVRNVIFKRGTKVIDIYDNKGIVIDDIDNKIKVVWEIDENVYSYDEEYVKNYIKEVT
jgi:hypothetical protein